MESNPANCLYKGHSVFRNQPSYTAFNKSFEDPTDALYLCLNEIHPFYLEEEQLNNNNGFETGAAIDPRTNKSLINAVIDQTSATINKPKLYFSPQRTFLSKRQHRACMRVILAQQYNEEIPEDDYIIWHRCTKLRQKEKKNVESFIADYAQLHKNDIYNPAQKFVELYKIWYARKEEPWLDQLNVTYNTLSGLPLVRVCKTFAKSFGEMINVEIVQRKGWVPVWNSIQSLDFPKIFSKLDTLSDFYNARLARKQQFSKEVIEKYLTEQVDNEDEPVRNAFYVPFETLLFLLTAGEYIDLPTETIVEISDGVRENTKIFKFHEMLPSRNCGWHTPAIVAEQAFTAYISTVNNNIRWAKFENNRMVIEDVHTDIEIDASQDKTTEFKPCKFDEYLQKHQQSFPKVDVPLKENVALVKWQLRDSETKETFDMLSTFELPPVVNAEESQFLGSFNIKLEYKPQFGCELMTKYELLKAWFQMNFLSNVAKGKCLRISIVDFKTQLEENLLLVNIEEQLKSLYQVSISKLLSNLQEFLKLLLNFPPNQYLMRYTPKYPDKMLLCAPAQEKTPNSIDLHTLVSTAPTDLQFMKEPQFLPISDRLCSIVHVWHMTFPCAFPHSMRANKTGANTVYPERKLLCDRELILKKKKEKDQQLKAKHKKLKVARRKKKMQVEHAKISKLQDAEEEPLSDMEKDRLLFGNS